MYPNVDAGIPSTSSWAHTHHIPASRTTGSMMTLSLNALYNADCLALLERVSNESATLVYLDPPWYSSLEQSHFVLNSTRPLKSTKPKASGQKADTSFDEYLDWMTQSLQQ